MALLYKGNMSSLSILEENLDTKGKTIYQIYKDSIIDLFDNLNKNNFLSKPKTFTVKDIEKIKKCSEMSDAAFLINKNVKHFFQNLSREKQDDLLGYLLKLNFITNKNDVAYQAVSLLCHTYQVYTEDIKKYMLLSINFRKLKVRKPRKKALGSLLTALNKKVPRNTFVNYLRDYNYIRNATVHYMYYLDSKELVFFRGFLGKEERMEISKFIDLTVDLNTLSNAFILIYLDKYGKIQK